MSIKKHFQPQRLLAARVDVAQSEEFFVALAQRREKFAPWLASRIEEYLMETDRLVVVQWKKGEEKARD